MAERKKSKGSRRSRHEWRTLLSKFDDSGLSVDAFCRRESISAASLYRWRNLLSDDGNGSEAMVSHRAPAFVDLGALDTAGTRRAQIELKLDLGDGLILHLVRG
jgi:transposase-like protein